MYFHGAAMIHNSLLTVWKSYIKTVRACDWDAPISVEYADIEYLEAIGACRELIEAAKHLPGINNIYWAPTEKMREYTPDCLAGSLVIGDDGCGNFIYWMDVGDANSKIIYVCHDPAVIMVIAETASEWLEGLMQGFQSPTFRQKQESDWGNFFTNSGLEAPEFKIWDTGFYNGADNELGLKRHLKDGLSYFDFADAKVGAGVSLQVNGKHTTLEPGEKTGIVRMGTLSKQAIKSQRKGDIITYALMAFCFAGCFYYFIQVDGKGMIGSFFSSLAITLLLFFGLGMVYIWLDGIKDRLKSQKTK